MSTEFVVSTRQQTVQTYLLREIAAGTSLSAQAFLRPGRTGKYHLDTHVKAPDSESYDPHSTLELLDYQHSVCAQYRSAPIPASPAPIFETSVLIELPGSSTADPSTLLTHKHPLHLVVLQVQPATGLTQTTSDTARVSISPSTSSVASMAINSQRHSWGQPGAAPTPQPGPGQVHAANTGHAGGALPGTMVRSAPTTGPAYFLTATSAQHGQQQGPGRPAHPLQSTTDLLRFSSRTSVIGTCHVDWRQALACKAEASCIVQLAGPSLHTVGHISLELEVMSQLGIMTVCAELPGCCHLRHGCRLFVVRRKLNSPSDLMLSAQSQKSHV